MSHTQEFLRELLASDDPKIYLSGPLSEYALELALVALKAKGRVTIYGCSDISLFGIGEWLGEKAATIKAAQAEERARCAKIAREIADDPHGSNPSCAAAELIAARIEAGE